MNKVISVIVLVLGVLAIVYFMSKNTHDKADQAFITVTKIVEHPALDEVYRGLLDELNEEGYIPGKTLKLVYESAQGDAVMANQIARHFVSMDPDVMVGIGTPSAQALVANNQNAQLPIVFSAITDPIGSQLVSSLDKRTVDVTGVSDWIDLGPQLELFRMLMPEMKRLGFIYNGSEANSLVILKKLEKEAVAFGLSIVSVTASNSSEVAQATRSLVGKVDAIYISHDNTALSAFESIVKIADGEKIPVFVSDIDMVERGATAALGPSQYLLGRETGKIIVSILQGVPARDIPVFFPKEFQFFLNLSTQAKVNIIVPDKKSKFGKPDKIF